MSPLSQPSSEVVTQVADVRLTAADGTRLAAVHRPGPGTTAVVLAHGFGGSSRTPAMRRVADVLGRYATTLSVDLRGHGRSAGRSTLGGDEVLDVDAAVAWLRARGHEQVVTCGWSMGASTVLRHAALHGGADAVVSVSAPSRWYVRDTAAMRRLHWLVEGRSGRLVTRTVLRTRLAPVSAWAVPPASPLEVVPLVAPTPLLLVHGDRDAYFPLEHPRALAAASPHAELWEVPGFGHAEAGADEALLDRLGRHLPALLARAA